MCSCQALSWYSHKVYYCQVELYYLVLTEGLLLQIELYNSMVDKEGTDSEVDAMKAYKAAHGENDQMSEVTAHGVVSSALIDKVRLLQHVKALVNLTLPKVTLRQK